MKISELAKKTGISAPTIRFYEQQGLLDARHVQRGANAYRDYSEEAVEQIHLIKEVQTAGFTLAEFHELDKACHANEMVAHKAAEVLQQKIAAVGGKIADLEQVREYLISKLEEIQMEIPPSISS